ncbi:MAG: sulfatase-like hydrolase/transferase, partial [Gammaproteobacteria bacterium]|nr:sulfatase-like hydrolase/transferase [Gammaproteobacteria bacterium]
MNTRRLFSPLLGLVAMIVAPLVSFAAADKPNILVIWGDDVGQTNISAYTMGLVGYETPNIDRIAGEGIIFTDYYAEQSCTAGRSTFITGQTPFRTGLSKVGLPGAPQGMKEQDATIAALLKAQGYATGQFGKNHLGDLDEHLPTKHGFDEFFGNLYHLNAEEEPENEDYPTDLVMVDGRPFKEVFGPRGVLKTSAVYDKNGAVTGQEIEDTGALTKKRMETVDDETIAAAIEFIRAKEKEGTPWFVWWNGTRILLRVHVRAGPSPMPNKAPCQKPHQHEPRMNQPAMHVG